MKNSTKLFIECNNILNGYGKAKASWLDYLLDTKMYDKRTAS